MKLREKVSKRDIDCSNVSERSKKTDKKPSENNPGMCERLFCGSGEMVQRIKAFAATAVPSTHMVVHSHL